MHIDSNGDQMTKEQCKGENAAIGHKVIFSTVTKQGLPISVAANLLGIKDLFFGERCFHKPEEA